jgi:hypothetical protein
MGNHTSLIFRGQFRVKKIAKWHAQQIGGFSIKEQLASQQEERFQDEAFSEEIGFEGFFYIKRIRTFYS